MEPLKKKYKDDNELIEEFCNRMKCHICEGSDESSGEPNGYGCDAMEDFVTKYSKGY